MRNRALKTWPAAAVWILLLAGPPQSPAEESLHRVWAVKDCKIITQSGPAIEKGTVVIRDGLIEAVGPGAAVPADAETIDGSALTVYPGLIDILNQSLLKLPELKFDQTKILTGQYTDEDKGITPGLLAFDIIDLSKAAVEKLHKYGFAAVQALPMRGLLTGQAAVFSVSGTDKNQSLLLKDNALGIGFSPANFMVYPNSLMGVVSFLRQEFSDVSYFIMRRDRWRKDMRGLARPAYVARHDLLADYAAAGKPAVFFCRNQHDIRRALELAPELKLDFFILDQGSESWRVLPELKKAGARVFCPVDFKVPASSLHSQFGKEKKEAAEKELYPKNPARLAEAGIPFAFCSVGTDDPKSFMEGVVKAVENGLPSAQALEAMTITASRFLGLDRALGTVEKGKIANLVLVEGDLLAVEPKVHYLFADGTKFDVLKAKAEAAAKPTVNVSGKWEFDIQGAGLKVTMDLVQEDTGLSGRMSTPFGAFDFTGGTVSGNQIDFETTLQVGGQSIDLYFSALVEGDRMTGSVVQGTEGSAEFTAKRIPG
ncbi:MAG: amidohydrolase family protein [Candidatus Aminicenantes bacterium]|nr:amidohydrolase family protein [Candidatus Aminicenantes bacterium]